MSLPKWVGIVQLPPLVGAPQAEPLYPSDLLQTAGLQAVKEAQAFAQAGFDGILLQNWGDYPYFEGRVAPETTACMAIIAAAIQEAVRLQVGIQVLGNDAHAALAIASVTGCSFIQIKPAPQRSNSLAFILREKERLHSSVAILVDLAEQAAGKITSIAAGQADPWASIQKGVEGVVIPGDLGLISEKSPARRTPVYLHLESDAHLELLIENKSRFYGVMAGSLLRKGGSSGESLELKKMKEMIALLRKSKGGNKTQAKRRKK